MERRLQWRGDIVKTAEEICVVEDSHNLETPAIWSLHSAQMCVWEKTREIKLIKASGLSCFEAKQCYPPAPPCRPSNLNVPEHPILIIIITIRDNDNNIVTQNDRVAD